MVEDSDSTSDKDHIDAEPPDPAGDAAGLGDDILELTLPELTRRVQTAPLPPPIQNPTLLPLTDLEPEVLERVVAEVVSRQDNLGVQFYGRRGQKQYGLDVVERAANRDRSLYQVKRYQELTNDKIRSAVEEYAGPPRRPDSRLERRVFNPRRFVVVTSAELDRDTANVNMVARLQEQYAGDLDIEVWGAEALSRKLRDAPNLVWAVFGPEWARMFCGFERTPAESVGPSPLGLVEAPVAVLGLESLVRDAAGLENAVPMQAAHLYGVVAHGLTEGGFPGHAAEMRSRQARAFRSGGDAEAAFRTLFDLGLARVLIGEAFLGSLRHDLEDVASGLGPDMEAKVTVLGGIADWYEHGSDLDKLVPALQRLATSNDAQSGLLCCLVLEQALVDGLYDFEPPRPLIVAGNPPTRAQLAELRELARASDYADFVIRTRLRCAVADSELLADSSPANVEAAYGAITSDASAGRLLQARGLAMSRAGRAFLLSGDTERAENLWRQSILATSEDRFYGDTRGAMRSLQHLQWESGRMMFGLSVAVSALPNRRRLLAAAEEPAVAALESIHNGRLPDALEDVRRYLWEARLAGHIRDEQIAATMLGDILADGKYPALAIEAYVSAGSATKASELAKDLHQPVDVIAWTSPAARAPKAAAAEVIGAQAATFPDDAVGSIVDVLLQMAPGFWEAPRARPIPELEALKATAAFGIRIPETAVGRILEISEPALAGATGASDEIANLLVQIYWALPSRRHELVTALSRMVRLPAPPHNLWGLIGSIPAEGRDPLLATVCDLALQGHHEAVMTLAHWREAIPVVQVAARQACAALLRRPVGIERIATVFGTQEDATVELLLALLDADSLIDVPASELGLDKARPAGGVVFTIATVQNVGDSPPFTATSPTPQDSAVGDDVAARTAAGPPIDLAVAITHQLMAMAEDHLDGAASRAQAVRALHSLLSKVPPSVAEALAPRLERLHEDPRLSADDLFELQTDTPLSRARIRTGGGQLAALALRSAAEAFRAGRSAQNETTTLQRDFVARIAASAAVLLRDEDREARSLGALALRAVAMAAPEFQPLFNALIFQGDAQVRAVGAAAAPLAMPLFAALASDPSPKVRQAVASRGQELPPEVRLQLLSDTHLSVRRTAESATATSS